MDASDRISHFLSLVKVSAEDERFFFHVFETVVDARKKEQAKDGDNLRRVCAEEYDTLSEYMDRTGLQESSLARNVFRTRRLANLLINDKGEINTASLDKIIKYITQLLYPLGPDRQHDGRRQEHLLRVLLLLKERKDLVQLLKQISKPIGNPLADQVIRDTLLLPQGSSITHVHAQRAALSAWLCDLRQKIGSCFATAPAIIVQNEQPEQFLLDLKELLNTGRLKRTFGGNEHSMPMSVSWGSGDLRRPVLLSFWEKEKNSAVWYAPGILYALEAAAILKKEQSLAERCRLTGAYITQVFPEWNEKHPYVLTSAEEIIQRILMHHLGLTPEDLRAYHNRSKGMLHTGLMMQMPPTGRPMGGKGDACANYILLLAQAKASFKALVENALLKTWEYSLASFAETKSQFTRWNLYYSLGLSPEAPHGIGQCIFQILQEKVAACNQKVNELQFEYEQLFAQLKQMEVRARNVSSEKEGKWVQAEYQSKRNEFYTFEEMRNGWHEKAQTFAQLYDQLIDAYDRLFPQYFQEVFDADLHEVKVDTFDDSPAGFRLLYKYGRSHTGQWNKIQSPQEYTEALANFFITTEAEITGAEGLEGITTDISGIITAIVTHVKTDEFLVSSMQRMGAAHHFNLPKNPLEHWEELPAKPWAYISGGTMSTLVSSYYSRESKPTEIARWVESPIELLVFLVDTLKRIPYKTLEPYVQQPYKSLLIHSPTHAFLLKPGFAPLKEAWQGESYTYTWVRDYLIRPMEQFVLDLELDERMVEYLLLHFQQKIKKEFQHYFGRVFAGFHGRMRSNDFRQYLVGKIESERGLHYGGQPVLSADEIDATLYNLLPLFPSDQLVHRSMQLFDQLPDLDPSTREQLKKSAWSADQRMGGRMILHAQQLQDFCLSLLCMGLGQTSTPLNYSLIVPQTLQQLGFAMPTPLFFADSNWSNELFAFVVSPGTALLELWRMDISGRQGAPMSSWREWLDGSRKDRDWGVYTAPHEYTPRPITRLF